MEKILDNLKFRAWHKKEKKMYYVSQLDFDIGGDRHITVVRLAYKGEDGITREKSCNPDFITLMQSTGLRDKHNKLIYEGDILAYEPEGIKFRAHHDMAVPAGVETEYDNAYYKKGVMPVSCRISVVEFIREFGGGVTVKHFKYPKIATPLNCSYEESYDPHSGHRVEVIGSIHQNPELLGERK